MGIRSIGRRHLQLLALAPTLALASCLIADNPKFTAGDGDPDTTGDGDDTPTETVGDGEPSGDGDPDTTGDGDPDDGGWNCGDLDPEDGDEPGKPGWLTDYTIGEPDDVDASPQGPGLVLVGGDKSVDAAFAWQADRIDKGDVVVLVAEDDPSYNEYLFNEIGGADSVQTLVIDQLDRANNEYVNWVVRHAEAVVIAAGSTQSEAVQAWGGSELQKSVRAAWCRGAILTGAGPGAAILGEYVFYAAGGPLESSTALDDPYAPAVTLTDSFWSIPLLARVVVDYEFADEDRMGRMLAFLARAVEDEWTDAAIGLGLDTDSAVVIDAGGNAEVLGSERAYLLHLDEPPTTCTQNVPLRVGPVALHQLDPGATVSWPGGVTEAASIEVSAGDGQVTPADPY